MQVSVLMVRALLGVVERSGASRERFLAAAGIEPRLIEEGQVRLPVGAYQRVIDAALEVTGDPALGLQLGELARSGMFDVLGPLADHAATLRELIEAIGRYSRLIADGHEPQLHEAGDRASIRFAALHGDSSAVRLTAEFATAAMLRTLRQFVGDDAQPAHVSFAYPAPAYAAAYRRCFGDVVRFDRPFTEIEFPSAWLDKRQLFQSPELYSALKSQAERTLDRLERDAAVSARVEQVLAERSPQHVSMDDAARALGVSARSLRRQLAAEGVSYSELVERARVAAAKRMLRDPRTSIQEAAYAMGFAAPAAFHRAFKRWTGMTPKQYRASF
jgi:AraC-like DNA-binding protein